MAKKNLTVAELRELCKERGLKIGGTKEELDELVTEVLNKPEGKFDVRIETGGEVYEVKTDDIDQAILDLNIKYTNTKTKIFVSNGKKEAFWQCNVPISRRLFHNKLTALSVANRIKLMLNEPR